MKRSLGVSLSLALSLALGCGSPSSGDQTSLVIGALVPRTGTNANAYWISALELAFAHMSTALNASAATRHLRLKLELRDDTGVNETAAQLAQELIDLKAPIIVSAASDISVTVNKLNYDPAGPVGIPVVCFSCTNAGLNNPTVTKVDGREEAAYRDEANWLWRTTITRDGHLAVLLRDMLGRGARHDGDLDGNGTAKIGMLVGADVNGTASYADLVRLADSIRSMPLDGAMPPAGATPVAGGAPPARVRVEMIAIDTTTAPDPETYDFAPDLARLFDEQDELTGATDGKPDMVVNWVSPALEVGVTRAYQSGGYGQIPMLHSASFRRVSLLQALGAAAEGQQGVSNLGWTSDSSGAAFVTAFVQATGAQPAGYDSSAYDAMAAALLAVVRAALLGDQDAPLTGLRVRDSLALINVPGGQIVRTGVDEFKKAVAAVAAGSDINYEGASGPCDFDAGGDIKGNISIYNVEGETFVDKTVYDCVGSPSCPVQQ